MIKLPKPVLMGTEELDHGFFETKYGYTEAQLKQAVRDAYEDAANVVDNADNPDCGGWDMTHIADAIRALIKEVDA